MAIPNWGFAYPPPEDRCRPERFTNDYFRDSLPDDLFELENAVVEGDMVSVRRCLERGADKDAPLDNNQMTALMIACHMGNWDVIKILVEEFNADLDGPLSRAGLRAIDYAGMAGFRFPREHPIVEYLKSKGSQHTWWGACCSGDYVRVKEYLDNGQDVDELNPIMWNGNAVHLATEYNCHKIAAFLVSQGGTCMVRNCHVIDTHDMKWSIGRGDAFYYKQKRCEHPGRGVLKHYEPQWEEA